MLEENIYMTVGFVVAIIVFIGLELLWKFINKSNKKEEHKEDRDDVEELIALVELYDKNAEVLKTYIACGVGDNNATACSCKSTMKSINDYVKCKYTNLINKSFVIKKNDDSQE